MRALTRFGSLAAIILFAQLATNCSSPLESLDDPNKNPPIIIYDTVIITDTLNHVDTILQIDTVFVDDSTFIVDTLYLIDTLVQIDTVLQIDTIFETDTVYIVDTVFVDTSDGLSYCAVLNATHQEVVWFFRNPAGLYRLEFTGSVEKERPPKEITVFVGDQSYLWYPIENMVLIFEQDLQQNVTVRLSSLPAHSFGHDLHVCLTMIPL